MSGGWIILIMALTLGACRPTAPPPQTPARDAGSSPPPPPVATAETSGAAPAGPRPTPTQPRTGTRQRDTIPIRVSPHGSRVSVAQLLTSAAYADSVVEVKGRCRGAAAGLAAGPPPSRGAWVLESEGAYIYVVGPFPRGCTLTTPSSTVTSLRVRVVEDTLSSMGGRPATPRRYLALMR